jgi:hypothetical protein
MARKPLFTIDARLLGATPKQIARELRTFSRSAKALSSNHPRLVDRHPKQWVAIYDGKIETTSKSFKGLMASMKRRGIPPSRSIIRYIDTSGRKLIL